MKKCPMCAEEIQDEALKCKHCGEVLGKPKLKRGPTPAAKGCLIFLSVFFFVGVCMPDKKQPAAANPAPAAAPPPKQAPPPKPTPPKAKLLVTSWNWSEEHGYITVEGEVKNVSEDSLDGLQAIATFTKEDGTFIKSDTGTVEYKPLLPNQTSPFKVMSQNNPAIKKASVEFKHIFGERIPTDYK